MVQEKSMVITSKNISHLHRRRLLCPICNSGRLMDVGLHTKFEIYAPGEFGYVYSDIYSKCPNKKYCGKVIGIKILNSVIFRH